MEGKKGGREKVNGRKRGKRERKMEIEKLSREKSESRVDKIYYLKYPIFNKKSIKTKTKKQV